VLGRFGHRHLLIQLDRDTQWQMGLVIPKDTFSALRAAGIESFHHMIAQTAPELADRLAELRDWKQTSLLSVQADRLRHWHRPCLLLIGDAAHVMSPAGGNGINYAIMDAVAAANILGEPLKHGAITDGDLARVQRRRERPTRIIQAIVNVIQKNVMRPALTSDEPFQPPRIMSWPIIGDMAARMMGFGIGREHVHIVNTT
jgi:2-polyprenyl-6-methoxyphenol hydroxylase-like FAD-dependent oxidoreductase